MNKLVLFWAEVYKLGKAIGYQCVDIMFYISKTDTKLFAHLKLEKIFIDFRYSNHLIIITFMKLSPENVDIVVFRWVLNFT